MVVRGLEVTHTTMANLGLASGVLGDLVLAERMMGMSLTDLSALQACLRLVFQYSGGFPGLQVALMELLVFLRQL